MLGQCLRSVCSRDEFEHKVLDYSSGAISVSPRDPGRNESFTVGKDTLDVSHRSGTVEENAARDERRGALCRHGV